MKALCGGICTVCGTYAGGPPISSDLKVYLCGKARISEFKTVHIIDLQIRRRVVMPNYARTYPVLSLHPHTHTDLSQHTLRNDSLTIRPLPFGDEHLRFLPAGSPEALIPFIDEREFVCRLPPSEELQPELHLEARFRFLREASHEIWDKFNMHISMQPAMLDPRFTVFHSSSVHLKKRYKWRLRLHETTKQMYYACAKQSRKRVSLLWKAHNVKLEKVAAANGTTVKALRKNPAVQRILVAHLRDLSPVYPSTFHFLKAPPGTETSSTASALTDASSRVSPGSQEMANYGADS
ncbi:hypothetical protein K525DRAFT_271405 [Schizophyllum commune Loenen D]|nr:hypothetical protein K525DRAFT_271405 [Schizophyllum commune Loenen D]